jgi:hypothetical protein
LSLEQVEEIRCRLRGREETYDEIGRRYGVTKSTVARIKLGRAWVQPR